jgi:hypothetical protein
MGIFNLFKTKLDNSYEALDRSYKILADKMGCKSSHADVEISIQKKLHEFKLTKEQLKSEIKKLEKQKKKDSKKYNCIPEYTPAGIMQSTMENYLQTVVIGTETFMRDFFNY